MYIFATSVFFDKYLIKIGGIETEKNSQKDKVFFICNEQ